MKRYKIFLDGFKNPNSVYSKKDSKDWVEIADIETLQSVIQMNYQQEQSLPNIISVGHDLKNEISLTAIKWVLSFFFRNNIEFPEIKIHETETVKKGNLHTIISKYLEDPNLLL